MSEPVICLILAMARNGCIGRDNDLPWHIPEDLGHFKDITSGCPVIMGRLTYESILARIGRPLPGRTNIVLSREGLEDARVLAAASLEEALETGRKKATETAAREVFVIGGANIYAQALASAERIYLTRIERDYEGDAFFVLPDPAEWREQVLEDHPDHDPPFRFLRLDKAV